MQVNLQPGDTVYYPPNSALGFLVERKTDGDSATWVYALRSPPRGDLMNIMVSLRTSPEDSFLEKIDRGEMEYYPSS